MNRETVYGHRPGWPGWLLLLCVAGFMGVVRPLPAQELRRIDIQPYAFQSSSSGAQFVIEMGGLGRLCMTHGAGYFVAPVPLPAGSHVERISAAVDDADEEAFALLSLFRLDVQGQKNELMAVTPMSLDSSETQIRSADVVAARSVTDTGRYLLHLVITGTGVCLQKATVEYR